MFDSTKAKQREAKRERGFSLVELLVAMTILLVVSSVVTSGIMQMSKTQRTIVNRTQMHTDVRSATELLQQEIGQSGAITLPPGVAPTLTAAVAVGATTATLSTVSGMFVGEKLLIGKGDNADDLDQAETVGIASISGTTVTFSSTFVDKHASGAPVRVVGVFGTGIVPPGAANGSTGSVLKLYGDVNGDGNMVYVEYTCDTSTTPGFLYRSMSSITAGSKAANVTLLDNVLVNPPASVGGANPPCFVYQTGTANGNTYVTDVAVTLTVQTQFRDPVTQQFQTETKALLNISPRNLVDGYYLDSMGQPNRLQPMPASVANLLP